jgi:DNA-directed RNA polymerase II subunit RPB2
MSLGHDDFLPLDDISYYLNETIKQDDNEFIEEYDGEYNGGKPHQEPEVKAQDNNKEVKNYPEEPTDDIDGNLLISDLPTLLYAEMKRKGIAGHHINSMNSFTRIGIKQIVTKLFKAEVPRMKNLRDKTEEDREIDYIGFTVEFTDVSMQPPTTTKYKSQSLQMLTPNMARLKSMTYSAQLYLSMKISATATYKNGKTKTREAELKDFRIASIPVMIRSELCNTYGCSQDTMKELEEDPRDPGGYFIVKGGEWTVDNLENLVINSFHCYKNMHLNEIVRGTFQSKPGDAYENSYYIVLKYLNTGGIVVELTTNKFEKMEIPFYVIFRAFGMTRDYDIVNHIVYGVENEDPITIHMKNILKKAFRAGSEKDPFYPLMDTTNPNDILIFIAQKMFDFASNSSFKKDENAVKYMNHSMHSVLDKYIFPHIGLDPKSRIRKCRFLGHLIHKLLRVEMEILESTDRDSLRNKRVLPAGPSIAKTFKTQFNFIIVQEIKKHLIKDFKSTPFSQVQLVESVKAAINPQDLERVLVQSITSGNKTITVKRNETMNRVSSQTVYHKNDLNVISTLNTINTPNASAAKQNERADNMRRVHPTYVGYIGVTQSADTGERVGMSKQMAVSASICEASSSYILKDILLNDSGVISLDDVTMPEEITRQKLAKIFVNGDWIGFVKDSHLLVRKYRMARRYEDINQFTTIVWDPLIREIYFWCDVGRLTRPLLIVYNNIEEFIVAARAGKPIEFKQWIKLKKAHIRGLQDGSVVIDDLRKERVLEYISPEEQENALIASSFDVLKEHVNDITMQFTHCDIEQAIFGMVELAAPNTNHTPATRCTMYTNQKKQTCGWFARNWPFRIDKNTFLQYYCEQPLVKVFSDAITSPNGQNAIVAYQVAGSNQEDSAIVNRSSIDRGMFVGSHFYYEKAELEKGEQFGNPDYARTMDLKRGAIYEFVKEGFIEEGTLAKKNYVLIVKSAKLPKPMDQYLYVDRSITYKFDEPAYIERVITPRNDEDELIAKVKMRSYRPLRVGDKLCLDSLHEVKTNKGWKRVQDITFDDSVACLVKGQYVEYQHPTRVYAYDHIGEMYHIKSENLDMCVTLNHRQYVKLTENGPYELIEAKQLIGHDAWYKDMDGDDYFVPANCGKVIQYNGKVYCIEVPSHIFYTRRLAACCWTGNSTRSGNKSIAAELRDAADMPYTEDGLVPDIILNPHCVPSRMIVGQLIETIMGELALRRGSMLDASPFQKLDVDSMIKELEEKHGIKYGGHKRMYDGKKGNWYDTLIFIGPVGYQRLQKFVIDESYSVSHGPTCALTRLPLDGKSNNGGLRLGKPFCPRWLATAA